MAKSKVVTATMAKIDGIVTEFIDKSLSPDDYGFLIDELRTCATAVLFGITAATLEIKPESAAAYTLREKIQAIHDVNNNAFCKGVAELLVAEYPDFKGYATKGASNG